MRAILLTLVALGFYMFVHCANAASFAAAVWRGETAYIEIPEALRCAASVLAGRFTGEDVTLELVRFDDVAYDLIERYKGDDGKEKVRVPGKGAAADVCRAWKAGDAAPPAMLKVTVSAGAKAGKHLFELDGGDGARNTFELTVVDRVLPPAADWKYFLDLWQHPWAVARYFGVAPFSPEHYAKMEPVWRALADCGCKALTVTLLDLPWNNQCHDAYHSMIGRVKTAEGEWKFDYSLFDEYVAFGRKCGLGPDIACYTMCPWGYMATWQDSGGETRRAKLLPGTSEFEEYWGAFLVDFAAHLREKGWFDDAYIAMDERAPEDVRAIIDLIQKKAPGMKVAMAGNKSPDAFRGMKIDNYCQGLIHLRKHPQMLGELEPRRRAGCKTTFYVCATAMHPNTFMDSPGDETYWLGAYPGVSGFDGFLRWAANSWPEDPYKDASFKTARKGRLHWRPGDTFLVYPGGELSRRMIELRAGVVAAEKLRILREAGADVAEAAAALAEEYGYRDACAGKTDFAAFRRRMDALVNGAFACAPLKVMTYNIRTSAHDKGTPNAWESRREDLAALVEREAPDVVGFQEVMPDQMEFLVSRLAGYTFTGEFRNADRTSGEASPVAFRTDRFDAVKSGTFWLSKTPDEAGSKSWKAALPRICSYAVLQDKASGRRFSFANTHTDHKSAEAREQGMLLVIERMKEFGGDAPIVFTGDHNCFEDEKPSIAVRGMLNDAMYASETPPEGTWRTFNLWEWQADELTIGDALKRGAAERNIPGHNSARKRIDYIYVSPQTRVLSFRTNPETRPGTQLYPSDHFPTTAEILLP